jgi:succinyl-diaminopimelate desuccinylase
MTKSPELELTRQLIRLVSTPESGGEPRVAELLADRLESAGFDVRVDRYDDGQVNVVARWGDPDSSAVCLSGHLDTVTVVEQDWTVDPYGAEILGSRMYGRGAVDMKSGVAALVVAAEQYVASAPPGAVPVALVLTAQEEVGSLGASALTRDAKLLPSSHLLIIAEPTSNRPVLGHRGAVWLDLVAQGRSCHGSTPDLGENAIEKLLDALSRIRKWARENQAAHDVLGHRTLNIGRVQGGALRNIVPDAAFAELDFRTPLEEDADTLAHTLSQLVEGQATVASVLNLPPVYTSPEDPWVQMVRRAANGEADPELTPPVARFFTDASILTGALGGIPTVICGPGSPDQAHVVDEWCEVDEIPAAAAIYEDVLRTATTALSSPTSCLHGNQR